MDKEEIKKLLDTEDSKKTIKLILDTIHLKKNLNERYNCLWCNEEVDHEEVQARLLAINLIFAGSYGLLSKGLEKMGLKFPKGTIHSLIHRSAFVSALVVDK